MIGKPLLALLAAPILLSATETSFPSPFYVAVEAIPKIHCAAPGGGWTGSGVRISDDIIITARHVTDGKAECSIDDSPLAYVSGDGDFAANRAKLPDGLRMIVSCAGIREGDGYLAAGYAFGGQLVIQQLVGTRRREGKLNYMSGRVFSGMSGGAVIDSQGRVVAIINQKLAEVSGANVTPLSETYLCR